MEKRTVPRYSLPAVIRRVGFSSIQQPAAEFDYEDRIYAYCEDYTWKIHCPMSQTDLPKDVPEDVPDL